MTRVIDGDTVMLLMRARLGESADEANTIAGQLQTASVRQKLLHKNVLVRIHAADIYGRALVTLEEDPDGGVRGHKTSREARQPDNDV